jgi:hypothetical protein
MTSLFRADEEGLGVPDGTFSGLRYNPKLDDALAERVDRDNYDSNGWRVLRRFLRCIACLLIGIITGAAIEAFYLAHWMSNSMLWIVVGMGIAMALQGLWWGIPKIPLVLKSIWPAIRHLRNRRK